MRVLSTKALKELLHKKTPDEIAQQEKDRLDDAGLAFLDARRKNPELEDFLRDSGRYTRELLENPPDFELPEDFKWKQEPGRLYRFVFHRTSVPSLLLGAAAAIIFGVFIFQGPKTLVLDKEAVTFQRMNKEPGAEKVDRDLFLSLKKRGLFFLEKAEETNDIGFYREAYNDLAQAALLNPEDELVNRHLREIHIIINDLYNSEDTPR